MPHGGFKVTKSATQLTVLSGSRTSKRFVSTAGPRAAEARQPPDGVAGQSRWPKGLAGPPTSSDIPGREEGSPASELCLLWPVPRGPPLPALVPLNSSQWHVQLKAERVKNEEAVICRLFYPADVICRLRREKEKEKLWYMGLQGSDVATTMASTGSFRVTQKKHLQASSWVSVTLKTLRW